MKQLNKENSGFVDVVQLSASLSLQKEIMEEDIVKITYRNFLATKTAIVKLKLWYEPYNGGKFYIVINDAYIPLHKIALIEKCSDNLSYIRNPKDNDIMPYLMENNVVYYDNDIYHGNHIRFVRSLFGYTGWLSIED